MMVVGTVVGLVGESVFMNCDHFHQDGETISVENIYPGAKFTIHFYKEVV